MKLTGGWLPSGGGSSKDQRQRKRFSICHLPFFICHWWIQLPSARGIGFRSSGAKKQIKGASAINISPRWGEETNNVLLHFQLESTNDK
jgi:hypothetical protein